MEESQLVRLVIQHDEQAFKALFDSYAGMVYNTTLNLVQNQEDAEDITQEVFVDISNKIESFKMESSLKTWIYRMTCNKALEHIRKSKRKKRFGFLVSIDSDNDFLTQTDSSIEEGEDKVKLLHQLIQQLPENQRLAFTLHHLDGLSYEEMAEVMETTLSAVESLMFRAKKNLKNKVALLNERNEKVQLG
ncbi:RNA polymerase sigma factor [Reichenbachiella ulvae]|uniref:RNA polymerase sigma factor n=1 Tax=Reichenbachiella ulvae TaxID=2980104 RepID=A0ABT3CYX8_9BACT|nr:RNA polymerase sigma factor [Reichenbachiella ulvae]MCV9388902.1 RNA polymerase sigma factor [Reichenbachiella ulvae]